MKYRSISLLLLIALAVISVRAYEEEFPDENNDNDLENDYETIDEVATQKANHDTKNILQSAEHTLMENLSKEQIDTLKNFEKFATTKDVNDLVETLENFLGELNEDQRKELLEVIEMEYASHLLKKRDGHHQKSKDRNKLNIGKRSVNFSDDEMDDFFKKIKATRAALKKHNEGLQRILDSYDKRSAPVSDDEFFDQQWKSMSLEEKKDFIRKNSDFDPEDLGKRSSGTEEDEYSQNEELSEKEDTEDLEKRSSDTEEDDEEPEEEEDDKIYYDANVDFQDEESVIDEYLANYSNSQLQEFSEELDAPISKRSIEHEEEVEEAEESLHEISDEDLDDATIGGAMEIDPAAFFTFPPMYKRSEPLKDAAGALLEFDDKMGDEMTILEEEEEIEKRSQDYRHHKDHRFRDFDEI